MDIITQLATELSLRPAQVESTVRLIDEGNTIPFIARYRKEATGSLDDNVLRDLDDRLSYLRGLEKRKGEVLASIAAQDKLTPELEQAIAGAAILAELEDLYRPYRPKRRTRASVAKERGLEPLALAIFEQDAAVDPSTLAAEYIDEANEVPTAEDALAGASDIIAEMISDDAAIRAALRGLLQREAKITTTAIKEDDTVYTMYHEFAEPVAKLASHRVLAIDRGEREEVLKVKLECDRERVETTVLKLVLRPNGGASGELVRAAATDSLDRLILPSLEREIRTSLTEAAAEQAIKVFGQNLAPLLLVPPLKGQVTMGLDPAYRTGCKIAVVDPTGRVLDTTVVYPTPPQSKVREAAATLLALIKKHGVQVIAIGNGTASRESEQFVAGLIKDNGLGVSYTIVNEAGASVYSASKLAAEEFPQFDVSLRSAVSIARRLQDPLAELVKIDPKSIGVGQYQHDMPKARLDQMLGGVVESCVNSVGVNVNTASHSLLSYVSGIGPALAKNIVTYREENGSFGSRSELIKVPKLGKKAYEQSAGFLRVPQSDNPLDNTAVHPESYKAAKELLTLCGYSVNNLSGGEIGDLPDKLAELGKQSAAEKLGIGLPTLEDITAELLRPGRDPRDELPAPVLRTDVLELSDLKPDMVLEGTVRNVIDFGAFVDIGVHQDGLVHISKICDKFIKHPSEVLKVGDIVTVKVLEVDGKRGRISLSMRDVGKN